MKASFLSENLLEKLFFVNHAVSSKSQLPILLNFLISAKKGILGISATDLEIGIKAEISANVEEEGEITVHAKTFSELIGTFSSGKITLEKKPEGLELTGNKIKTVFQTTPAEEFPKLYEKKGDQILSINTEVMSKDFPKIVFAASQDLSRPALSGVLVKEDPKEHRGFIMVATDGYRLSLKKKLLEKSKHRKEGVSMLIPSRVIREIILIAKGTDEVSVYALKENNQIIFSQEDIVLVGRLIEAEFPAFEKIIPNDFSTRTVFDREDLQRAVKACYVFARSSASIIKISVRAEKVVVYANAPSVGQNTVEIDAKTIGEENEIAFNARYLLDFFSHVEEESISFEMTGPLNPGVFKIEGDDSFLHLIMPIRVQQET